MPAPVFAAHELALTLSSMQIRARSAHHTALTPPGAVTLARVKSPPLSVLVKLMDVPSDDLIADLLVKQLGARFAGVGSLSAGAGQISADLTSAYHINPVIHDGSGLDREDSSSPAQIVSLLSQVRAAPAGALLAAALPTVGRQGTVAGIGLGTYAVGHCVAKTGTLSDVSNLAGYCTARDGHTLAFALMVDGPSNFQGIAAISKAVGAIASY
jgi:D-alanyl-D-alanine carboxypeptidase/D-alanyl-D-alanine-endopeptidase (penicillin-binding protein 4)